MNEPDTTNLRPGDRVLVSEYPAGPVRHTVTRANATTVWTEEVPEGFSRAFVLEVGRPVLQLAESPTEAAAGRA